LPSAAIFLIDRYMAATTEKEEVFEMPTMTEVESLPIFEEKLEEAELTVKALRQVVEGLRLLNGHAPRLPAAQLRLAEVSAPAATTVPKGIKAVLAIMDSRAGKWTRGSILKEFAKRGWFHTTDKHRAEGAVDAALYRLCQTGRVQKLKPGVYRVAPTQETAS
jgi:hypothetical protein